MTIFNEVTQVNRRPQYHYFYGSTEYSADEDEGGSTSSSYQNSYHNAANQSEQESLLGESLVPTDNEDEPPVLNEYDLQQVLITNGDGGLRPLLVNDNASRNKGASYHRYYHRNHSNHNDNHNNIYSSPPPLSGKLRSMANFILGIGIAGNNPVVHVIILVIVLTLAMFVFSFILLFPTSSSMNYNRTGLIDNGNGINSGYDRNNSHTTVGATTQGSSSSSTTTRHFRIPFPVVDRSTYGEQLENFVRKDLFQPDLLYNKSNNNENSAVVNDDPAAVAADAAHEFIFPFPTGAFWINLVLPPTADQGFSYPIVVYPYAYKWSQTQLILSYPWLHRKVDSISIHDYFYPDLTFGTKETVSERHIVSFDALSVTIRYGTKKENVKSSSSNNDGSWESYLVQGSPYSTIRYYGVTPTIHALSQFKHVVCPSALNYMNSNRQNNTRRNLSYGVCSHMTEDPSSQMSMLWGVQFILQTQEGVNWILFTSKPITLTFDTRIRTTVTIDTNFSGIIRLAVLPPSSSSSFSPSQNKTSNIDLSSSSGLRRLVYHSGVYPVGGDVGWDFRYETESSSSSTTISSSSVSGKDTTPTQTTRTTSTTTRRVGTIHFQYATESLNKGYSSLPNSVAQGGKDQPTKLLMLGLPHHVNTNYPLSSSTPTSRGKNNNNNNNPVLEYDQFDLVYRCIKGNMKPIVGSYWSYDEPLLNVGFDGSHTLSAEKLSIFSNLNNTKSAIIKDVLLENLENDIKIASPTLSENIYGFGKQVARLAQLAHIVSVLVRARNVTTTTTNTTTTDKNNDNKEQQNREIDLQEKIVKKLRFFLESFLNGEASDSLVYDANTGGIVSIDGLKNHEADFGNGRYNDHHFHYGYLLYACAVLGRLDSNFTSDYMDRVDAIFFDIAYTSNIESRHYEGLYFPLARHMSWYDGHSYASGLFPFADGKSQESSSEAVNAYYGAYLWSLVRHGYGTDSWGGLGGNKDDPSFDKSARTDFTRLLLAMEVRGAKTYWHMTPPTKSPSLPSSSGLLRSRTPDPSSSNTTTTSSSSSSSPSLNEDTVTLDTTTATTTTVAKSSSQNIAVNNVEFAENYMVGNLGMLDVTCSTWFGKEPLYVHMINFLPVTGITRDLFDKDYVKQEYKKVMSTYTSLNDIEMAWRGYAVSDHAIIEPESAWKEAQNLSSLTLDSGISKSQILFFIICDNTFNFSLIAGEISSSNNNYKGNGEGTSSSSNSTAAASCQNYQACFGLSGKCCPTNDGNFLGCCGRTSQEIETPSNDDNDNIYQKKNETLSSTTINPSPLCESNPPCASTGLTTGSCCPTSDGIFLSCCAR